MVRPSLLRPAVLLAGVLLWISPPLPAQGAAPPQPAVQRVPVTIALTDQLPDATSPAVIPRAAARPGSIHTRIA